MSRTKDLTGQRFGKLTVEYEIERKSGHRYWRCLCDCGEEKDVRATSLVNQKVANCGCDRVRIETNKRKHRSISPEHDITGNVYGLLTVIAPTGKSKYRKQRVWLCKCDCGVVCEMTTRNLTSGNSKSCGCKGRRGHNETSGKILENFISEGYGNKTIKEVSKLINMTREIKNIKYVFDEYSDSKGIGIQKLFDNENEAVSYAKENWNKLVKSDKQKISTYRVYGIEITDEQLKDYHNGVNDFILDDLWVFDVWDAIHD